VGCTEHRRWFHPCLVVHAMTPIVAGAVFSGPGPTWWVAFCLTGMTIWSIRKIYLWHKRRKDPTKFLDDDD